MIKKQLRHVLALVALIGLIYVGFSISSKNSGSTGVEVDNLALVARSRQTTAPIFRDATVIKILKADSATGSIKNLFKPKSQFNSKAKPTKAITGLYKAAPEAVVGYTHGMETFFSENINSSFACMVDPMTTQGCGLSSLDRTTTIDNYYWPEPYDVQYNYPSAASEKYVSTSFAKVGTPSDSCTFELKKDTHNNPYDPIKGYSTYTLVCGDGVVKSGDSGWTPSVETGTQAIGTLKYHRDDGEQAIVTRTVTDKSTYKVQLDGSPNTTYYFTLNVRADKIDVTYPEVNTPIFTATNIGCRKISVAGVQASKNCTVKLVGQGGTIYNATPFIPGVPFYTYSVNEAISPQIVSSAPPSQVSFPGNTAILGSNSIVTPQTVTLSGTNFETGVDENGDGMNEVRFATKFGDLTTYSVTGAYSADGTGISFNMPTDIPSGAYDLSVSRSNSDWSEPIYALVKNKIISTK